MSKEHNLRTARKHQAQKRSDAQERERQDRLATLERSLQYREELGQLWLGMFSDLINPDLAQSEQPRSGNLWSRLRAFLLRRET